MKRFLRSGISDDGRNKNWWGSIARGVGEGDGGVRVIIVGVGYGILTKLPEANAYAEIS